MAERDIREKRFQAIRKLADQEYVRTGGSQTRLLGLMIALPVSALAWWFSPTKRFVLRGLLSTIAFFSVLSPASSVIGMYRGDKSHSVAFTDDEVELMRGYVKEDTINGLRRA